MQRRLALGLLLPLALGGALAGCGDDEPTGSAATTSPTAATGEAGSRTTPASAEEVDAAFVRQMIPHHQMAVGMAEIAVQKAEHPELKAMAKTIIEAQNAEIEELDAIRRDLGVEEAGAPQDAMDHAASGDGGGAHEMGAMNSAETADAATMGLAPGALGMSMDMGSLDDADPFDVAFIDAMRPHHEGAIAMADAQLARGKDDRLRKIATAIKLAQSQELAQMAAWKKAW